MKFSKKLALAVLPSAVILAGCANNKSDSNANAAAQAQAQQVAAQQLAVYEATTSQVNGYRPIKVSADQTIYVSQSPVFTRANVTQAQATKDNQGRSFIVLGLDDAGKQALGRVDASRGYVTVVDGQVASLSGTRQNGNFLLQTRDDNTSAQIIAKAFPEQAAAMANAQQQRAAANATPQQRAAAQQQAAAQQRAAAQRAATQRQAPAKR